MREKWPREYAYEIAQLNYMAARQEALAKVPKIYQELVKTHVNNIFSRLLNKNE